MTGTRQKKSNKNSPEWRAGAYRLRKGEKTPCTTIHELLRSLYLQLFAVKSAIIKYYFIYC
jgi:hypothetical protein